MLDGNGIDEEQARILLYKVFQAVQQCHDRLILIRDIKAENIMLAAPGDFANPVILDPDDSRKIDRSSFSPQRGTPYYNCPEIFSKLRYGMPADAWSSGVLMYRVWVMR